MIDVPPKQVIKTQENTVLFKVVCGVECSLIDHCWTDEQCFELLPWCVCGKSKAFI